MIKNVYFAHKSGGINLSFFSNLVDNGKNLGTQIGSAVNTMTQQMKTDAKFSSEKSSLQAEIDTVQAEINKSYQLIGQKYVEHLIHTQAEPIPEVTDTLRLLDPKLEHLAELNQKMIEIEKKEKDQHIIAEKMKFEQEYQAQKEKLDKALKMGVITQDEYMAKIKYYINRLDNFEEIKRIKAQYDMGIIGAAERDAKLRQLGVLS